MNKKIMIWIFGFMVIMGISLSYAQPPMYHEFYGEAKCLDGDLLLDGTNVIIKFGDIDNYANVLVNNGKYHIIIQGSVGDNEALIEFYASSELLGSEEFTPFGFSNLDLISQDNSLCEVQEPYCGDGICNGDETCSSCPSDCGTCDDDGGGGGGGGIPPSVPPSVPPTNLTENQTGTCNNECNLGDFECLSEIGFITCGDYDNDSCYEWSLEKSCNEGYVCSEEHKACVSAEEGKTEYPFDRLFIEGIIPYALVAGVIIFLGIGTWLIIKHRSKIPFGKITFFKKKDEEDKFYKLK